jgi:hypothetical protein
MIIRKQIDTEQLRQKNSNDFYGAWDGDDVNCFLDGDQHQVCRCTVLCTALRTILRTSSESYLRTSSESYLPYLLSSGFLGRKCGAAPRFRPNYAHTRAR